jgi:hypothetical protein
MGMGEVGGWGNSAANVRESGQGPLALSYTYVQLFVLVCMHCAIGCMTHVQEVWAFQDLRTVSTFKFDNDRIIIDYIVTASKKKKASVLFQKYYYETIIFLIPSMQFV